jgi:hypothetical protein
MACPIVHQLWQPVERSHSKLYEQNEYNTADFQRVKIPLRPALNVMYVILPASTNDSSARLMP